MSQVEGAKLDAVEAFCRKLEGMAAVDPHAELLYPISMFVTSLRAILDYSVPGATASGAEEKAMSELGLWSERFQSAGVTQQVLAAYLASELVLLSGGQGWTEATFMNRCRRAWRAIERYKTKQPETARVPAVVVCRDDDCSVCAPAPRDSEN